MSDSSGIVHPSVDEAELHAFVDGSLPAERRSAVLAYLLANPAERERVETYRRQASLLGEVRQKLDALDSAAFQPALQRRLAAALEHQRRRRSWGRGAAAAAVALLTLAGAAWSLGSYFPTEERETRTAAADLPEFPFGGNLLVPASGGTGADGEAQMSWLAEHLSGQTLKLPDLGALGLELLDAAVVPKATAPAVRLVYNDTDGRHLMLFVGVVSSSASQAFTMVPEGYLSLHWRRGSLVFALAGPLDSPQLYEVMRQVSDGVVQAGKPVPGKKGGSGPLLLEAASKTSAPAVAVVPVGVTSETAAPAPKPQRGESKPAVPTGSDALPAATDLEAAEQPKSL